MSLLKAEVERNKDWSVVYERAIKDDGTLFFPERISHEFLLKAKKSMGSQLFANQYLNEVFPAEDAKFKREWFRYYTELPRGELYTFAHIDPAISTEDGADYTGIAIVSVDSQRNWYLRHASRSRLTPTQIVERVFWIQQNYNTHGIGVESVAYQKAIIHLVREKMDEWGSVPLKEIRRGPESHKETRILGLVPLLEWNKFFHLSSMIDFEKELLQFPRSAHDDIIDAVSSLKEIIFYPSHQEDSYEPGPHSSEYERRIIQGYVQRTNDEAQGYGGYHDE